MASSQDLQLFDDVHVITSFHNVPMATGEYGCSCVKKTQHFSFIVKSCKPRIFCAEIGNLCSESAVYLTKMKKYADFG